MASIQHEIAKMWYKGIAYIGSAQFVLVLQDGEVFNSKLMTGFGNPNKAK